MADERRVVLDDRKSAVLRAVVQSYIETAQPVGSGNVAGVPGVEVSSATVRNDMTFLEQEGYLAQPHKSAGRIPTEKGYRFFVDHLELPSELDEPESQCVGQFFAHAHGELEGLFQEASHHLARLTSTAALTVGERGSTETVRSVQLVSLSDRLVVAVAVLSNGMLAKRTVELSTPLEDAQLAVATSVLSARMDGVSVDDMVGGRTPTLAEAAPRVAPGTPEVALVDEVLAGLAEAMGHDHTGLYVEGASNMARSFEEIDTLHRVLALLEQQVVVVGLLRELIERGLTVAIGSETGLSPLSDCSLVVAPVMVGPDRAATLAVLGPTRMNYSDTLSAVDTVSRELTRALGEGD